MSKQEKTKGFKTLPVGEFIDLYEGNGENEAGEMGYRRGYLHGYHQALKDKAQKRKTGKFTKFDGALMRWRYGKKPFKSVTKWEQVPQAEMGD